MAEETDNRNFVRSIVDDDYIAFENELAVDDRYDFPHSAASDFDDETNNATEDMMFSSDGQEKDTDDEDFEINEVETGDILDFAENEGKSGMN